MLFGILPALTGFFIIQLSLGLTIASVFQLAHLVECTHFTKTNSTLSIDNEWAVHQVITTADFATGNKLISWFTGGLNYQVEHHLYPKISHVHYPAIHGFVKEACKECNTPLILYQRFSSKTELNLLNQWQNKQDVNSAQTSRPRLP